MPRRARAKTAEQPQTTQQRLAAVIKRCRDIMRIDPGLNGDLDRLPQMAWLLFLKAFDDLEERRAVLDEDHRQAITKPYRWRDWARNEKLSGDGLLDFVNGKLLPYLRELPAGDGLTAQDKIRAIFQGLDNRMRNGYQLRELINEIEKIHFDSADDIHTMAHLYESMLREVRDAAGDSGEFYTPRPLVRFMVQQVNPKLGEVVLDPAAGTGGFLIESLEHMRSDKQSVAQRERLHASLRGFEKKPLPFLLSTMNMLLHGVDAPRITSANSLGALKPPLPRNSLIDVVLTNPPFGGAESAETAKGFPKGFQTAETAWLFLYAVMETLKPGGRCGIVVPNSVMFDTGVGGRVKKHLFETCDLHTVVRLPDGVFSPYTDIPSNLLFFEKGRPTKEVWFYQISPPEGRKKYTKTRPMPFEEFAACQQWWGGDKRTGRKENEHAWKIDATILAETGYNLDIANPNSGAGLSHNPPQELINGVIAVHQEITNLLVDLSYVDYFFRPETNPGSLSWGTTVPAKRRQARSPRPTGFVKPQRPPLQRSVDKALPNAGHVGAIIGSRPRVLAASLPAMIDAAIDRHPSEMVAVESMVRIVSDTVHPGDDPGDANIFVGLGHIAPHLGVKISSRPVGAETGRTFRFRSGDVLFGYLRPYRNKVWRASHPGLCSVEQFVLRADDANIARYLAYVLRGRRVLDQTRALTNNLQLPRLGSKMLLGMGIPLPPMHLLPDVLDLLDRMNDTLVQAWSLAQKAAVLEDALEPALLNTAFTGES